MAEEELPELPDVELPAAYREARARRNSAGRRRVAEEGRLPNGRPPFGFRLVTKADVMRGRRSLADLGLLEEHEENAGVVRGVFRDYLLMRSVVEVAEGLNRRGEPAPQGKKWYGRSVANLLRNTAYVGRYVWGKTQGESGKTQGESGKGNGGVIIPCPVLVDARNFAWTQELLRAQEPVGAVRGEARQPHLLGDIARCVGCGGLLVSGTYVANPQKGWTGGAYYACKRCPPCERFRNSPRPQWTTYPAKLIEKAVWNGLAPMLPEEDGEMVGELVFAGAWRRTTMRARRRLLIQAGVTPWVRCEPFAVTIGYREGREMSDEERGMLVELLVSGTRRAGEETLWAEEFLAETGSIAQSGIGER